MKDLTEQLQLMHRFFNTRKTYDLNMRLYFLKKLKKAILSDQDAICKALYEDFKKPYFETYMTEIYTVLEELNTAIKNLKKWAKPQKHLAAFPLLGTTKILPEPYGVCAIFAPYNYPFQLTLSPLIGAIAAGNVVIIKPSEYTSHTSTLIDTLLQKVFPSHLVYTVIGDATTSAALLKQPLDYIFFTGSTRVGKIVMEQAAKTLTPVTLELGGKNPAIVDYGADIQLAAKRIAWGKFLNGGQTCVAPDYVLVHDAVAQEFLKALREETKKMFSNKNHLSRMIHEEHYVHVLNCIDEDKLYHGGHFHTDDLFIEPTILYPASLKDDCMQEEIFGPVLPVIPFSKLSSVIDTVHRFPKPLACYIFSKDRIRTNHLLRNLSFGCGAINDTIMQLNDTKAPFGGVGYSGMGTYHGKYSFDTFTHYKTILCSTSLEIPLRYPPHQSKLPVIKSYINLKFK